MGRYAISLAFAAAVLISCSGNESVGAVPPPAPPPPPVQTGDLEITVDATQKFQTIEGFGVTSRLFSDPHLIKMSGDSTKAIQISDAAKNEIYDLVFKDLKLTRLRPIYDPRGIEAVNDNADPNATDLSKFDFRWKKSDGFLDQVRSVRQRGVTKWWLSPYWLELWMTNASADEYAEWAMATLHRWKDAGLELQYISIVSEPSTSFAGPWSSGFLRDAVKALGRRIKAEGLATRIVIPDELNPAAALPRLQTILADAEARSYLGAVAVHLYGLGDIYGVAPIPGLAEVKAMADQYGLPLWMTEYFTSSGFQWAVLMHRLLAEYNFTAIDLEWGFFGGVDSSHPLVHLETNGQLYTGYTKTPWYYMMGQYSRFIPPGARRIAAISTDPDVIVSAFYDGSSLAIVAINRGGVPRSIYVRLKGLNAVSSLAVMRSAELNGGQTLPDVPLSQSVFRADLPAQTITTFSK